MPKFVLKTMRRKTIVPRSLVRTIVAALFSEPPATTRKKNKPPRKKAGAGKRRQIYHPSKLTPLPQKLITSDNKEFVFINCPFDDEYLPLLRAAVFAVYRCGFCPVTALTEDNGLDNRIDKIFRIIERCRYGIHDISRTELAHANNFPRFNMPFELGVFYGARRFGNRLQKNKNALILERVKYTYQQYLSDINGVDTRAHNNEVKSLIRHIRNWLRTSSSRTTILSAPEIISEYDYFIKQLPALGRNMGFDRVDEIPFNDYCQMVEEVINAKISK